MYWPRLFRRIMLSCLPFVIQFLRQGGYNDSVMKMAETGVNEWSVSTSVKSWCLWQQRVNNIFITNGGKQNHLRVNQNAALTQMDAV